MGVDKDGMYVVLLQPVLIVDTFGSIIISHVYYNGKSQRLSCYRSENRSRRGYRFATLVPTRAQQGCEYYPDCEI